MISAQVSGNYDEDIANKSNETDEDEEEQENEENADRMSLPIGMIPRKGIIYAYIAIPVCLMNDITKLKESLQSTERYSWTDSVNYEFDSLP